ncbi:CbtB-domain containing protein [Spongisporangium articulatum]|uniref:CbtB-domain containing protein n=1 Tax=Spongisporangium articulatum TaxID=3362603 RepID=A0ABW8ARY3_9ACTN
MSSTSATPAPHAAGSLATPVTTTLDGAFGWLLGTALLALAVLYFVGIDQGMVSVFGNDTHVHEFVHDARHFLGFPCH